MSIKILVMPADLAGCGSYRLKWPALAIDEPGVSVEVIDRGGLDIVVNGLGEVVSAKVPPCDVLVIQRPLDCRWPRAIELLRKHSRVAVVVDVDDAFHSIHPRNAAFPAMSPATSPLSNWDHLAASCRAASIVTVSTPALADVYGAHGRVRVLPNCIPERYLSIDTPATESIGWPGWVGSHPDDLTVVRAGVAQAVRRTGWGVRVVGPGDDVARQLGVPEGVVEATGFVPFADYPEAVGSIGVGIAPLRAGAFSDSKSWLKPLELSSLGVPVVASPTPEYRRLAEMGAGIIAAKPKDWERELVRLIEDADWWVEQSAKGRAVAASLTIEAEAWRWCEAWTAPVLNR